MKSTLLTFIRTCDFFNFVPDNDIIRAAQLYGYDICPVDGDDFENGIKDWNENIIMTKEDFQRFSQTGIGLLDFGNATIYSKELKNVDIDELQELPLDVKFIYVDTFYEDFDEDSLISEVLNLNQKNI